MKIYNAALIGTAMLFGQNVLSADEPVESKKDLRSARDVIVNITKPEAKEHENVDSVDEMFSYAKVSGNIETIYSYHDEKSGHSPYSTDVGGQLKYELAKFKGFGAGVEFTTSRSINALTGDDERENTFISSPDGSYTQMSQAYLEYKYEDFDLKVGRQLIDTPLADSDDYRIINNTFEAAIATYDLSDFSLMLGYLDRWQGTDAGLDVDNPWQETGKDGTYFGSVAYENGNFSTSAWYYDISATDPLTNTLGQNVANKTAYIDGAVEFPLNDTLEVHLNAQYVNQSTQENSDIEASIYGLLVELQIDEALTFGLAYNNSERQTGKGSFSGFGGGTLFTSMDNMILDNITLDRDASAVVAGITYGLGDFSFLYAYGDFDGDADSLGEKEHIIEQNIGTEYAATENLVFSAIIVIDDDKEESGSGAYYDDGDFTNYRLAVNYHF